jgi:hypothetical protein
LAIAARYASVNDVPGVRRCDPDPVKMTPEGIVRRWESTRIEIDVGSATSCVLVLELAMYALDAVSIASCTSRSFTTPSTFMSETVVVATSISVNTGRFDGVAEDNLVHIATGFLRALIANASGSAVVTNGAAPIVHEPYWYVPESTPLEQTRTSLVQSCPAGTVSAWYASTKLPFVSS